MWPLNEVLCPEYLYERLPLEFVAMDCNVFEDKMYVCFTCTSYYFYICAFYKQRTFHFKMVFFIFLEKYVFKMWSQTMNLV